MKGPIFIGFPECEKEWGFLTLANSFSERAFYYSSHTWRDMIGPNFSDFVFPNMQDPSKTAK